MLRQHGAQSVPAAPTLVPQARQRGGSSKSSAVPASRRKTAGRARLSMPAMTARRRCRCQRRSRLAVLSRRHTGLFYVILLLGETIVAASDFEERAAGGGIFHLARLRARLLGALAPIAGAQGCRHRASRRAGAQAAGSSPRGGVCCRQPTMCCCCGSRARARARSPAPPRQSFPTYAVRL